MFQDHLKRQQKICNELNRNRSEIFIGKNLKLNLRRKLKSYKDEGVLIFQNYKSVRKVFIKTRIGKLTEN